MAEPPPGTTAPAIGPQGGSPDACAIQYRLAEARRAHARGWQLTPLRGKRPLGKGWQKAQAPDLETIERWARNGNIGLRTGKVSGVVVIDDDTPDRSAATTLDLPPTVVAITGGGGRHYYFGCPEGGLPNSAGKLAPKVDVRGDGGQVVYPGSVHPDTGANYRWADGLSPNDVEVAPLPQGVFDCLVRQNHDTNDTVVKSNDSKSEQRNTSTDARLASYAAGALRKAVDRVSSSKIGERNDTLNRESFAIGRLVGAKLLQYDEALRKLVSSGIAASLPQHEAQSTARSGLDAGQEQPIDTESLISRLQPRNHSFGTELWFARRLVSKHGRDMRHVGAWGKWMVWSEEEGRWKHDTNGEIERRAKDIVADLLQDADDAKRKGKWKLADRLEDIAYRFQSRTALRNAFCLAASERSVVAAVEDWDRDHHLLNVANGTIDLRDGHLREHRRDDFVTKRCPVRFVPGASAPRWDAFLARILPDTNVREYLQRFLGYSLTGDVGEHTLHIFWGGGANGKSTLLEAVMATMGDYAAPAPPTLLIQAMGDRHPTELASLHGRRLVISSESPEGGRLNENLVKSLTGGDAVMARRMREDFWSFAPTHKLVLATNHRPRITGTDEGIWRRLRLVPFVVTIPEGERDQKLGKTLAAESEGILAWLVRGAVAFHEGGLQPPEAVRAATDEYRDSEDSLAEFIEDRIVQVPGAFLPSRTLHETYRQWCDRTGIPEARRLSQRSLTERCRDRGYTPRRTGSARGFANIQISDEKEVRNDVRMTNDDARNLAVSWRKRRQQQCLTSVHDAVTQDPPVVGSCARTRAWSDMPNDAALRHQRHAQPAPQNLPGYPDRPCFPCHGRRFHRRHGEPWVCAACHPAPSPEDPALEWADLPGGLPESRQSDTDISAAASLDPELEAAIDAAFVRSGRTPTPADRESWRDEFEERAATLEFEAGLPRGEAEARARTLTIERLEREGGGDA